MHGEVSPNGSRMTEAVIEREENILKPLFEDLLIPAASEIPTVSENQMDKWIAQMDSEAEESGGRKAPENLNLPVGYTYFGQLVAHDITSHRFLGVQKNSLRLQTIYGMGPGASPQFFEHNYNPETKFIFRAIKFDLDSYQSSKGKVYDFKRIDVNKSDDAPTRQSGIPLMADGRNDQNFLISQLTVQMMRLHNRLVENYYSKNKNQSEIFRAAADDLIHRYQRVILTDYLPRILFNGKKLVQKIVDDNNFRVFDHKKDCVLSETFALAAFRFGHSQVRQMYQTEINGTLNFLFGENSDLRGFVRDTTRRIDWICLLAENKDEGAFQPAKAFDTNIVMSLGNLGFFPAGKRSLIKKNLEASIANFALTKDIREKWYEYIQDQSKTFTDEKLKDFEKATEKWQYEDGKVPLWAFFLLEAQHLAGGQTLGPISSRIVAEQIIWLLKKDPNSVLAGQEEFEKIEKLTLRQLLETVLDSMDADEEKLVKFTPRLTRASLAPPTDEELHIQKVRKRELYDGTEGTFQDNVTALTTPRLPKIGAPTDSDKEKRSTILFNGFYRYPHSIESSPLKKEEIRVYFSKKMVLGRCSAAVQKLEPKEEGINGLFFIFGLDKNVAHPEKVFLLARRTGLSGALPVGLHDNWLAPKKKTNPVTSIDALTFSKNFASDGYETLKEFGLESQKFVLRDLVVLLGYDETNPDVKAIGTDVTLDLVAATGTEIAASEGFALDASVFPEDALAEKQEFFGLSMSSSDPVSEPGRPYPPYCYARDVVWK